MVTLAKHKRKFAAKEGLWFIISSVAMHEALLNQVSSKLSNFLSADVVNLQQYKHESDAKSN